MREYLLFWSAKAFFVWLEIIIFLRHSLSELLELLRQSGGQRRFFGLGSLK